jgi:hypothetical protein
VQIRAEPGAHTASNDTGTVYQKDLGDYTARLVKRIALVSAGPFNGLVRRRPTL